MSQVLLHGILEATIHEIDRFSSRGCCIFSCQLLDKVEEIAGIEEANSKLYVAIGLDNAVVGRTKPVENDTPLSLNWHESFRLYCAHEASEVTFAVKLENPLHTIDMGTARFPAKSLLKGEEVDQWMTLMHHHHKHKPIRNHPKIHIKLRFFDVSRDKEWSKGIPNTKFSGVPNTFFPPRNGCRVTLYQDAHVPDGFLPEKLLSEGKLFSPNRCWEDVFDAIYNAKHLIYIAGWSIFTKITLIRDVKVKKNGSDLTLGELLIKKAKEGVKVLMLVWDDRTSVKLLNEDGVMATNDENTESYFNNTGVCCVLCPREPDKGQQVARDFEVSLMFTHHQKIIVVDTKIGGGLTDKRRIVIFVGGIDLCNGRYDTPSHSIFRTLGSTHRDDFHQPNFKGATIDKGGPREPWHDIHCKLEGPIVWDVLHNFEQRWEKQARKKTQLLVPKSNFAPQSSDIFSDHESWNVQLFRSIDGGAAWMNPASKDRVVERSIQDAYINAIRRAKSFIYIENQYFIGSSFGWKTNKPKKVDEFGASHLIPKELSLKIVSKIEAGERFTVYVVIPMWPEGIPSSDAAQSILNWQRMTMEMMYTDISQALRAKGLEEANPRDYLTFFCLGNRETKKDDEDDPKDQPERNSDYMRAQQSRRFMIYVHSKMMIVDDEYIIVGSANINQRSMDGARDTEIAVGAYQPSHLSSITGSAKGQIHGHRLALWYEHMGFLDDEFLRPESLECVRKVNEVAENYWGQYSSDTLEHDLPGHLLSYPINVTRNGNVATHPGQEFFPDTNARILGSSSGLPAVLTT